MSRSRASGTGHPQALAEVLHRPVDVLLDRGLGDTEQVGGLLVAVVEPDHEGHAGALPLRQLLEGRREARLDVVDPELGRGGQEAVGGPVPLSCALANPERAEDQYLLEPALRARIAAHHAADMALYRWALLRRDAV